MEPVRLRESDRPEEIRKKKEMTTRIFGKDLG